LIEPFLDNTFVALAIYTDAHLSPLNLCCDSFFLYTPLPDQYRGVRVAIVEQLASVNLDQVEDVLIAGLKTDQPKFHSAIISALAQALEKLSEILETTDNT
jgi:hypothetical protein